MKNHPAQLIQLEIGELSIVATNDEFSPRKGSKEPGNGNIKIGISEFNVEESRIAISLRFESSGENNQFSIKVEIRALFQVEFTAFESKEGVEAWAKSNGYYILLPYLREQVYSLSLRAGFDPVMLPLVEVPTFQMPVQES